jgi:ribosome-associated heat shock protein Hsp15
MTPAPVVGQRLDQWLWCARFAKSRTLAQVLIAGGKVRVNRIKTGKPSHAVKPGDVVTLSLGPRVRIVEVKALAKTRRPASEAALLFQELTPTQDRTTSSPDVKDGRSPDSARSLPHAVRHAGSGRPTKQDRRALDRLKDRFGSG